MFHYCSKLKQHLPLFILFAIELALVFTNYTPHTYFLGWDNLFPEMNFLENIRRSFFSIWQEYRGLGLLDGMSFAANLPHYLFLYLLSFIMPLSFLRYFFIFLMHFLGGVGMYFLIKKLFINKNYQKIVAFFGSIFYLFNIATVQMFFAPYELFTIHFVALPWLILFAISYFETNRRKHLILFAIFSFLSTAQAHVPTIFIVYSIALFILIVFYLFEEKKQGLKKAFIIIVVTFCINSFWGLPYIYTAFANAKTIANSKINQMATEDVYLQNKAYGDFQNVALLKGYILDSVDTQPTGKNNYMMLSWKNHIESPIFSIIGFLFFGIAITGIISILFKKEKKFYPFLALFIISFLMLGNAIPLLGKIYDILSAYIPYFYQIFRFTFTKFSILFTFSFSIFFAQGLILLFHKMHGKVLIFILSAVFLYYSFPSFQGQFLYNNLRLNIPDDYFNLVSFFKKQNTNGRIALLPQPSFWGWTYTNWGYRGSGFIWYGLPQASMDGAFYPWSRENENYYWEMAQAIYSQNKENYNAVLEKYQIHWVIVDHTITSLYSERSTYTQKTDALLKNLPNVRLISKFGAIDVYKVALHTQPKDFAFVAENLPSVGPQYQWNNLDYGYMENGNYISGLSEEEKIFYPFRSLFTGRKQSDMEFLVSETGDYISFQSKIPKELTGSILTIPNAFQEEVTQIDTTNPEKITYKFPDIFLDKKLIPLTLAVGKNYLAENSMQIPLASINAGDFEVRIPKIEGYYSYYYNNFMSQKAKNCDPFHNGSYRNDSLEKNGEKFIRLTSINARNCLQLDLPNLSQRLGYLISIKSAHKEGKPLLFSVINKTSEKPDIETNLSADTQPETSYFIVPPMEKYGLGYSLYLDNASTGSIKTINDIYEIKVNVIPYRFLTSLKIENMPFVTNQQYANINNDAITVSHPNPSLYQIRINNFKIQPVKNTLVLSQSYANGWKAYQTTGSTWLPFIFGKEIKNHVLVNNWANGWILSNETIQQFNNSTIVILFLPQYLEYFGFILLFGTFGWIIVSCLKR